MKKTLFTIRFQSRASTNSGSDSAGAWRALTGSRVRESRGQNGIKAFLDVAVLAAYLAVCGGRKTIV